ncbi:MAG: inorganic phosphate transporter [Gemmataceae bacterium]
MSLWDALSGLPPLHLACFTIALVIAFGFEFINGFHDTANAVTTVIYTHTLKPTPAVVYSGFMNFFGVLLGGTGIAFGIVHLLPVDVLIQTSSTTALVTILALLLAGLVWNLSTWYLGLPVSSSHTLIGSILGVGVANGLYAGSGLTGVNWHKAGEVLLALIISPLIGFILAAGVLLLMRATIRDERLYVPPQGVAAPPWWVRAVLLLTCGGVSYAHGSNDGQKGMGLILLVLVGFLPSYYALNNERGELAPQACRAAVDLREFLKARDKLTPAFDDDIAVVVRELAGKSTLAEVAPAKRWEVRQAIFAFPRHAEAVGLSPKDVPEIRQLLSSSRMVVEFVPLWVVMGVALSLGIGTMIGYQRVVVTVAEKIGKAHLTYAQGAAAELVAAITILAADIYHLPVSTTQVLASGIGGTMVANGSGVQRQTLTKIGLAWVMTLPCSMLLAAVLYFLGRRLVG